MGGGVGGGYISYRTHRQLPLGILSQKQSNSLALSKNTKHAHIKFIVYVHMYTCSSVELSLHKAVSQFVTRACIIMLI